ncbi:MAG: replicative DNA helicase [Clostridia bacterium]|nr:replicative DNA helicase [Clostridia bacterium]
MAEDIIRKLPFSAIAEQSLLGSILIDPASINMVADILSSDDFYLEEHKQIYLAMHALFLTNSQIDVVTLIDELVKKGVYSKSGGEEYIKVIAQTVPNSLNVKDYAKIVKDKSILRQLISMSNEISDAAYSEQDEVSGILESAQNKIYSITQGRETKSFRHIREVITDVYAHLKALATDPASSQGTATGFRSLDRVLAGMGNSDLVIVGARPGMGKTSFCLNIGTNVAKQTKKAVAIFSLEMSAEQLVSRVISSEALVDSYALRTGELKPEEWDHIAQAASSLSGCDILIDDTPGVTVTAMKAKLRRVKNLGLVIIDYLQLMQSDKKIENRTQEVSEISRALKILAKELNVPVICCSQLSRGTEGRTNKRPMPSDLRESGSIEQDADVIIFLYRDEFYKNAEGGDTVAPDTEQNVAEIIVAKNRHGSTETVKVGWTGRYTKFRDIALEENLPQ